jgi:hypothetical protein
VLSGGTGAGKSTSIASLAKEKSVQRLLKKRMANGIGTQKAVAISVTNSPDVPEEYLFVRGTLQILKRQDVGDDNKMLADVTYSAVKDAQRVKENQQEAI